MTLTFALFRFEPVKRGELILLLERKFYYESNNFLPINNFLKLFNFFFLFYLHTYIHRYISRNILKFFKNSQENKILL